jgi:hypothetical protein
LSSSPPNSKRTIAKITRLIDALTSPKRQNIAAWRYVAEMLLLNLPNCVDLNSTQTKSLPFIFGDVLLDGVTCSVKSSFQENVNSWAGVANQAGLHSTSLFDKQGNFKSKVFQNDLGSMIFCFRDNTSMPEEDVFTINWWMTDPVRVDDIESRARAAGFTEGKTRSTKMISDIFGETKFLWACTFTDLSANINNEDLESIQIKQQLESLIDNLSDSQVRSTIKYINALIQEV